MLALGKSQNNYLNRDNLNKNIPHYPVVIICPLTSKVKTYKGCPVIHPDKNNNLKVISQAIPFQIRTVAKTRLKKKVGVIPEEVLAEIKRGLDIFLTY